MGAGVGQAALPIMAGIAVGAATGGAGFALMPALMAASAATTVVGGVQSLKAGQAAKAESDRQEKFARLDGAQKALDVRERLNRSLGAAVASASGRGVLGTGTSDSFLNGILDDGERAIEVTKLNTSENISAIDSQGNRAQADGQAQFFGSLMDAGVSAYSGYQDYQQAQNVDKFLAGKKPIGQPRQLIRPKQFTRQTSPSFAGIY